MIEQTRSASMPSPEAFERLLRHVRDGSCDLADGVLAVDPSVFSEPGVAKQEREQLFGRVPFIVAHSSELAGPGDFVRLQLPNNEALLVRDQDSTVRAFVNVCRHRGNLLEARQSGTCRAFSCPYHGWSYNPDGSLRTITYDQTFGTVDRSQMGLVSLPTCERHGLIWVIDDPDATLDLDEWLGDGLSDALDAMQLGEFTCFRVGGFDEHINWKVMQDAFLDGYHIRFVHPKSAGPHFHTNHHVYELLGRHVRFYAARRSIDRFLTEDWSAASMVDHVTMTHFVAPNVTLLRQPDHYQLLSFFPHPLDPARSRMEMRLIVPPLERSGLDADAWNHRWDRNWEILMDVLRDEDFPLLRDAQRALQSRGAGPLVYGRNEMANQVFHRAVEAALS